ncbi:MAG: hypothetical protein KDC49_07845 [Saprospiraceae bacterium]|nr:hypothetical protein [Saprospiraceae bacterium]
MRKSNYIYILLLLLVHFSCGREETRTTLNAEERVIFDSLSVRQFEDIRRYTDSVCLLNRDSMYNYMVDSLLRIRLIEIENLVEDEK